MKKILIFLLSLTVLIGSLSGCQQQTTVKDDDLVTENNYLSAEFSEIQMTSDGTGIYFCYSPYALHYVDTDTNQASILCSKPDCPHYVENPAIESLDCFAQMIYDGHGSLYYYQQKLYYTLSGQEETSSVFCEATPTGTETKTLTNIQDFLSDDIDSYLSNNSGSSVVDIYPQILGARSGKLYINTVITYTSTQNIDTENKKQYILLYYDISKNNMEKIKNDEIVSQLDACVSMRAVLCGKRMICLVTLIDKTSTSATESPQNTYQLISLDLDSGKTDKTLHFEDVGILTPHITQNGDFYITESLWDSESQTQIYHEYDESLEEDHKYPLDMRNVSGICRMEDQLFCVKPITSEKSDILAIDLNTEESNTYTVPYSLAFLGDANGKLLAFRDMTKYFLIDVDTFTKTPETAAPSPIEGMIADPYIL